MTKPKIEPFPLKISAMFQSGLRGYVANFVPLTLAGAATLAVYASLAIPSVVAHNNDNPLRSLVLNISASILAGTAALPWFTYALNAARGEPIDLRAPFREWSRFLDQFVCSFWFWGSVILGFQYLLTIPSWFVASFYAFFGYVVADRAADGPLRALGTSVRLGDKRRIALLAILALFFFFNFLSLIPLGFGVNEATLAVTALTVTMTASITLVAWATLYDVLGDRLAKNPPLRPPHRKRQQSKSTRKPFWKR